MTNRLRDVDPEIEHLHRVIAEGSLAELESLLKKGAPINGPGHCGDTAPMAAIDAGDLEKLKLLIRYGADPEVTNNFNDTSLRHAVIADSVEAVEYLLSLGVERGYHPKYPLKAGRVARFAEKHRTTYSQLPEDIRQSITETEWKNSMENVNQYLREMDEHPTSKPIISNAHSLSILKLFLEAGDDLSLASRSMQRVLLELEDDKTLRCTSDDYRAQKAPRFGTRNPETMDLPFWREMIRTGISAYSASVQFNDADDLMGDPVWCYDRFGSSLTPLPDGRYVQIAGEHEDYYDPDFYIYNDVVIYDGKGDFHILGYPREIFPPTDFHSATLSGNSIYIIGCLGYPEQRRESFTPVYRLTLDSWMIEAVETTGEMPSWIHRHRARFDPEQNTVTLVDGLVQVAGRGKDPDLVPNEHEFQLDLTSLRWRRTK